MVDEKSIIKREPDEKPTKTEIDKETRHRDREQHPFSHTDINDYNIPDHMKTFLQKYFTAKKEFYNLQSDNREVNARAAKYLRDTAENFLLYLERDSQSPAYLLHELQEVFEYSKRMTVAFMGGKKRRFEVGEFRKPPRWMYHRYSPYSRENGNSYSGLARRHHY